MNRIAVYLNRNIDGVVYSAPSILERYSTDRSLLKIHPRIVAVPANAMDVRRLARFSYQLASKHINLPLTVRGAGYSKTGSCISSGILISTEKLNLIQEIDTRQRLIRVQAGVTLGELKKALSLHGLDLPIIGDPHETIGGLIARNASASINTEPKTLLDFIDCAEVVLSDGSLVQFRELRKSEFKHKCKQTDLEGSLYWQLNELITKQVETIKALPPNIFDRSGYSSIQQVKQKHSYNLLPLLCGSEGTLGIITEVILRCEPVFEEPNYLGVVCQNASSYFKEIAELKKLHFTDMRVYDTELFNETDATGKSSKFFRHASDDGYLIIATAKDDSRRLRKRKLRKLGKVLAKSTRLIIADKDNLENFTNLEENLSAYLNDSGPGYHFPVVDGVYIPPAQQVDYLDGVTKLAADLKLKLAVYGLPEFDTFTVRPSFATSTSDGRKALIGFLRRYLELVKNCQGYACGEAAEGRFLAMFTRQSQSTDVLQLYGDIKHIFDPLDVLNPGIKQEVDARAVLRQFRIDYNIGILPNDWYSADAF